MPHFQNIPGRGLSSLIAAVALFACEASAGDADQGRLIRVDPWISAFETEAVKVRSVARAAEGFAGRLLWSLSTPEKIPLSRGEVPVANGAEKLELEFPLTLPSTKPGAVMTTLLKLQLVDDRRKEIVAELEDPLWIYPADPFFDRTKWLEDLKLSLYDLQKATIERLTKEKVPFETVTNISSLEELRAGMLIIGEGVSFREERGLSELMISLAARGVPVLCLAPQQGEVQFPTREPGVAMPPEGVLLQGPEAIRRLDKRLDPIHWMGERSTPSHTLVVSREGRQAVGEITPGADGWSFLDVQFARSGPKSRPGRLVVCCFPIIRRWENGPTPRFLLKRLLESVTSSEPSVFDPPRELVSP